VGISRVIELRREVQRLLDGTRSLVHNLNTCMYQSTVPCGLLIESLLHRQPRN
jgi:hypothetical protein